MPYKPDGFTSLAPYLIVDDADAALRFIQAVFDARPSLVHRDEGGRSAHVEVPIDDTILMIGEMPGAGSTAHIHVYVPDVDASFARARAAGGTVVQEPVRKGDVDRRCGITDPTGTTWWLATQEEQRPA